MNGISRIATAMFFRLMLYNKMGKACRTIYPVSICFQTREICEYKVYEICNIYKIYEKCVHLRNM